ncbi:alcohol dehydrogenase zinc-binding domain protein [Thamnocephalis sphaerospora]|uniref:Alcohol dehydrogenase zinc-binding domain protein n=1 Tax=Thamnocephalis sphaerospora TaxID=78915 RepID=A0A4P9XRV5_9FUNG|nr:alcohol dehydrogenase zinc-binding domain protein [Thamnocephalis sphaerospora]|eukprot:RKP08837.1 alcohol dehydrogenase zinc-binding domain protein [Thamnocephalis sphaerospora]
MRQIFHVSRNTRAIRESPDPSPAAGEVLIEVKAASKGLYPDAPSFPFVVGYEAAGRVSAVGDGVDRTWLGADVVALVKFGAYSELITAPVGQIARMPSELSYEMAASMCVAYLTAWMLIAVQGGLHEGDTLLIQNAGSGVGLAAIDIAHHLGAGTIIGTASERKHQFLIERGLQHPIDYRKPNWTEDVKKITGKRGVDLIIDPLGPDSWKQSSSLLGLGGRLGVYGASEISASSWGWIIGAIRFFLRMPTYRPLPLMDQCHGVFGTNLLRMFADVPRIHDWLVKLLKGVEEGWVHPHVDRVFGFDQVDEAYAYIESRQSIGRVVLVPNRAKDE